MTIGNVLFTYRRYAPVPFFIAGVVLANPRPDLIVFGALLIAGGALLRLAAVSYSGPLIRQKEIFSGELITNGPFAYLRNPVYFANIVIYSGASILCGAWLPYLLYIVLVFFSIYYILCIRYEEETLGKVFGASYDTYRHMVPRFFPRLSAYPHRGNKKADIKAGFQAESSTLLMIFSFVLLIMLRWYLSN